jgi:hypothetical protein
MYENLVDVDVKGSDWIQSLTSVSSSNFSKTINMGSQNLIFKTTFDVLSNCVVLF